VFLEASGELIGRKPELSRVGALVLYRTLGPALPEGLAGAAALWYAAHVCAATYPDQITRAGIGSNGGSLGDALFDAVLASDDGVVFTRHTYDEAWDLTRADDRRLRLNIPELVDKLDALVFGPTTYTTDEFPFVLSAGERRSFSANTIFRDPSWRKTDREGALAINPDDARDRGLRDGDLVRLTTATGSVVVVIGTDDSMRPGHISIPNGMGLDYPDETGTYQRVGVAPNDLTALDWKDDIAGTPWHKHVPARLDPISNDPSSGV
jgi:formate dehydrogenase